MAGGRQALFVESIDSSAGIGKVLFWFPGILLIPIPFPLDEVLELSPIEVAVQNAFNLILCVVVNNFGGWGIRFGLF